VQRKTRGFATRAEFVGRQPTDDHRRSRVLVMELARLQRALGAAMPPSTQSPGRDWAGIGRHGHGTAGDGGNPDRGEGVEIPTRGGSKGSNRVLAGGLVRAS
jgi:hypothetical protein